MYDNYNYPPGADGPNAPWNQEETPERDFNVTTEFVLKATWPISTDRYYIDEDPEGSYIDTSDVNWREEFSKQYRTPVELLQIFKKRLEEELPNITDHRKKVETQELIAQCSDWEEELTDIYEED